MPFETFDICWHLEVKTLQWKFPRIFCIQPIESRSVLKNIRFSNVFKISSQGVSVEVLHSSCEHQTFKRKKKESIPTLWMQNLFKSIVFFCSILVWFKTWMWEFYGFLWLASEEIIHGKYLLKLSFCCCIIMIFITFLILLLIGLKHHKILIVGYQESSTTMVKVCYHI